MKNVIPIVIATASLLSVSDAQAAAQQHRTHHHRAAVMGATISPALLNANASLNDNIGHHGMHMRNLHDSGYNPKNDVGPSGNVSDPSNW
ncbi:hypothetical protein [Bradyrhizobium sp. Ai1a-2]|uniref:hypothetical protein n=1 Tax=Bradyrhizobium sp. Ai1a-2 TaxID=196490 RepID=UPI000423D096|nr:hypothetical protein [Bradyrhizobium sp. Ai1a-2]